jgi:hypothetical protein
MSSLRRGSLSMPRPTARARGSSPTALVGCSSRDQAITALTVTELLEIGHSSGHPLVLAFEEELQ